jgi:hypothetical protein
MTESLKTVTALLTELCELLEQYAPSWYTQDHHDRTQAALRWLADTAAQPAIRRPGK